MSEREISNAYVSEGEFCNSKDERAKKNIGVGNSYGNALEMTTCIFPNVWCPLKMNDLNQVSFIEGL